MAHAGNGDGIEKLTCCHCSPRDEYGAHTPSAPGDLRLSGRKSPRH